MTKELKEMSNLQKQVFMLLPRGIDNPISVKEIIDILEIDDRTIMSVIETLIMKYGIPIGSLRQSNKFGYFIATNEEEKRVGIYSNEQQVKTMKKRITRVKDADLTIVSLYKEKYKEDLKKYERQANIFEYLRAADDKSLDNEEAKHEQAPV